MKALVGHRKAIAVASLLFSDCVFASPNGQSIFELRTGFWCNLHHFLLEQSIEHPNAGQASLAALPQKQAQDWSQAVEYYREAFSGKNLLGPEMQTIKNALADIGSDPSIADSGLVVEFVNVLEAAAPVYRANWWSTHDASNRSWIDQLLPLLVLHGSALKEALSDAYNTAWPETKIETDVVFHANWAGAYTTLFPTRITISSEDSDQSAEESLEMIFHEASHALVGGIQDAISDRVRAVGKLLPRKSLWHALLFYTTGEIVRRGLPGYTPYANRNGLWTRVWPGHLGSLEREWKPYLDGDRGFDDAIEFLVDALVVDP